MYFTFIDDVPLFLMNVYWKSEYNIEFEIFLLASDFCEPKQFCDKQTDLISEMLLDNLTLLSL